MDQNINYLRELSKSNYWQTLYSSSKEMNGIRLFKNEIDFTNSQVEFLNYLSFYNSLNLDIYMGEVEKDIVSKSFMREDAYMYYKRKKDNKSDTEETLTKPKNTEEKVRDSWVFQRSSKGK